jgi:hypothetical protein
MAIDVWLPQYQVSASYSILVHASAERYCWASQGGSGGTTAASFAA